MSDRAFMKTQTRLRCFFVMFSFIKHFLADFFKYPLLYKSELSFHVCSLLSKNRSQFCLKNHALIENKKSENSNKINGLLKRLSLSLFCMICFMTPMLSFAHGSHPSEKEIETAIAVFEKAILLSPEFIEQTKTNSITPFYILNGHKVYLTDGFWNLTRAWLRIYIQDFEKHCPCDLDPELMIQTAKKHAPSGLFKQASNKTKNTGKKISYSTSKLTAQYGYTAATLKVSSEIAETILSVFMGMHGAHIWCNVIDAAIIPLARYFQKYIRVFSYGNKLSYSRLIFSLRMVWLSRQIRKSQKKAFFIIETALDFNKESLEQVNQKGPKKHRLLWLNKLKRKTDPLFEQISQLEQEYHSLENRTEETAISESKIALQQKKLTKKIEKLKAKINRLSQVNRKSFFGNRFKRYLLLRSRKGQTAYMSGQYLPDKIAGKKILWPLALQENILEPILNHKNQAPSLDIEPDEIQKGLVEEFFLKRQTSAPYSIKEPADHLKIQQKNDPKAMSKESHHFVYSLLESIEQIFNTEKDKKIRMMNSLAIENNLAVLFGRYLQLSLSVLNQRYNLSYKELIRLYWLIGRFSHSVYEFSDFLSSVSIVKNKNKIKFYKYEAMEKLLAFLDYLYEVQTLLANKQLNKEEIFNTLRERQENLISLSLLRDKKTAFNFIPFKKAQARCNKLVEK